MKHFVLITILLSSLVQSSLAAFSSKISDGNKLFNEKKYDEALLKYNDAQIDNPASPEIFFNMGTVYYRQKKYPEAIDLFQKSIERSDVELEAKALYNIGNSLFQQGRLQEALGYYKQSLDLKPDDHDIKYNIEYTEKKIKEMMSQSEETRQKAMQDQAKNQKQSNQKAKDSDDSKRDKDKEASAEGAQKEDSSESEKHKVTRADENKEPNKEDSSSRSENKSEGDMTKEEAEKFLSSFDSEQKNLTPTGKNDSTNRGNRVEQDW